MHQLHENTTFDNDVIALGPTTGSAVRMGFFMPEYAVDHVIPYYTSLFLDDTIQKLNQTNSDNAKPLIYGSLNSYEMFRKGVNLLDYLELDDIYDFVALGSESKLTDKCMEMYDEGLPFVANLYTPHLDFGLMKLVPVIFPFNPSGS
eukprot:UN31067